MNKKLLWSMLLSCMAFATVTAQVIENFETGLASASSLSFRNQNSSSFSILNCQISPNFGSPVFPVFTSYNVPNQKSSIVSAGNLEPILQSYGVSQNVVGPSGGRFAIRLNDVIGGGQDITSFEKKFVPTNQFVSFDYMAAMDASHVNNIAIQPFFTARLLDDQHNLIQSTQFCIMADPAEPLLVNIDDHLFFTKGWYCGLIVIPEEYIGETVFLQFITADCGASGHRGVAYVDNIINDIKCKKPQYGFIELKPVETKGCKHEKVEVCGYFSEPHNSSLSSIDLEILQNGVPVTVPAGYINLTSLSSNSFCFTVDFAGMGISFSGDYEFSVNASFTSSINGYVYNINDTSSNAGPDISFGGGPALTTYIDFNADTISWNNTGGTYTVEFYGDGSCCPGSGQQPPNTGIYSMTTTSNSITFLDIIMIAQRKCVRFRVRSECGKWTDWCCITSYGEGEGGYIITTPGESFDCSASPVNSGRPAGYAYPNPTTGKVYIKNSYSTDFQLYDLSNNIVLSKKTEAVEEITELDVKDLKQGIYVLKTDTGQTIKIVKN